MLNHFKWFLLFEMFAHCKMLESHNVHCAHSLKEIHFCILHTHTEAKRRIIHVWNKFVVCEHILSMLSVEHCPKIIILIKSDAHNYVSMFDANYTIYPDYEKSLTRIKTNTTCNIIVYSDDSFRFCLVARNTPFTNFLICHKRPTGAHIVCYPNWKRMNVLGCITSSDKKNYCFTYRWTICV